MKPGDLIRVKKSDWMPAPGFLLSVVSVLPKGGYRIIILSGPHLGKEHTIYPKWGPHREFEVING